MKWKKAFEEPKVYGEYFCISNMGRKMKVAFHPEAKWHPQDIPMYADGEIVREWLDEQADDWIDADITPPQLHQDCAFIVISKHDPNLNGRVLGGRYYGDVNGYHEFAVPGHGYYAKLWQPLPSTPQGGDKK